MNRFTLLFNNPIQENQYRHYIKNEREKPLRIIVTLQSFNEFIILSTVVYYYLSDKNNFGNSLDFIVSQVSICVSNIILAVLMFYKMLDFGFSLLFFILVHILRVTLTCCLPRFFEHQLQFFSQFQYGYSCFLIIIIITFSYHFFFKAAGIVLLNSVVFFLYEYAYNNFYTMSFISAVLCYKVFTDEKTFRQDFLIRQKMEKWMLIVDKVIPSSVFITKFNPREEIIELSQSNQKAKVKFDVKNSEQFQAFIARTFLDKNSEETAAQNNHLPPNNLKVRIRNLIEKEKLNTLKKQQQRKSNDGLSKLKITQDNKNAGIYNSHSNILVSQYNQSRNKSESKYSGRSDSIYQGSPHSQAYSRNGSLNNQPPTQGNLNNIPLPFRNIVKKYKDNGSAFHQKNQLENSVIHNQYSESFHSLSNQQATNQAENDQMNMSSHSQPVMRKYKRGKTIKNRNQIVQNQPSQNNNQIQALVNDGYSVENNLILGNIYIGNIDLKKNIVAKQNILQSMDYKYINFYLKNLQMCIKQFQDRYYRKDELSEQQTFSIKLYSYYLEEIYVIVVIDEESYEERLLREKNKLRDFQTNSNRFVNELSQSSRNMFTELRSQQIYYLNQYELVQNIELMREMNMRAINHCFGIINNIDNFIICHNSIPTTILEDEIKEVDMTQLLDNLIKVLQIQKEDRNIKCIIYNTYKKNLLSSSKYITQLLFNLLSLSFQVCSENGLVQIEAKEMKKSYYTSYIEICIKHTLKEDSFSIFNFCEQQKMTFETSKKLLELISPYSKFFIKQRKNFYAQIKFYLYKDLNEIQLLNKTRQTMYHAHNTRTINAGNHLIEQEECVSDDLSIEQSDPSINKIEEVKEPNQNAKNCSKILNTSRENTDNIMKLSSEYTENDLQLKSEQLILKKKESQQANHITSSVFVEGISGYKIHFGKLFAESQKNQQNKNENEEDEEYEDDEYDQEDLDQQDENQKTDQEYSSQINEIKNDKTLDAKTRRSLQIQQRKNMLESSAKNEEKKVDSDPNSNSNSKKRFSSRLDTRNTTQKSQIIRSKQNSCFNENNNENPQLYIQENKIQQTIKEADEEMTKSMSSNGQNSQFSPAKYKNSSLNDQEGQQLNGTSFPQFQSMNQEDIHNLINKDEIKEFITDNDEGSKLKKLTNKDTSL